MVYENIKNAQKIFNLLRLIAFQIGSEVSLQGLGKQLGISKNTVEKYLDSLSKVFILHKVEGFSRNLRKEITKNARWYFLDNGIRNAVIANFNMPASRNDIGALWENYMIGERLKQQEYQRLTANNYFWRTYEQQEIDWVEEREGILFGYEFKWKESKVKVPTQWKKAYPVPWLEVIDQDNFSEWLKLGGELLPRDEAKISAFNSGYLVGDGVWEAFCLYKKRDISYAFIGCRHKKSDLFIA